MDEIVLDHSIPIDTNLSIPIDLDIEDTHIDTDSESVDSLDTIDYKLQEAKRQLLESLQQLNQVVNWVILPLLGKYLGRKCALFLWKRLFA